MIKTTGITDMLNRTKTKALLTATIAASILICGCGVKKDSDDKVLLQFDESITEVTSDGQKDLLEIKNDGRNFYQFDPGNNLLIASGFFCSNVSIINMETGAKNVIGFPESERGLGGTDYEGQELSGQNAWYEDGKVSFYATSHDDQKLVVFTFDCATGELKDTARYDVERPAFVRDAGNYIVYVKSLMVDAGDNKYKTQYDLNIFDKTTGEDITVAINIGKQPARGYDMITLNSDKTKVLFTETKDNTPALYEYDIPSGEIREVYKCSKDDYISGFTYAWGSNKIYLRYGRMFSSLFNYECLPNYTMVITTDGRTYELHSSLVHGYNINYTGIAVY